MKPLLLATPVLLAAVLLATAPAANAPPLAAVAGGPAAFTPSPPHPVTPSLPDPFPLLRRYLPPGQVDAVAARVGPGGLRRLPRDEFEARVQSAAAAALAAADPPRLAEARYRAALAGDDLAGTADWTLTYPAGRPGLAALDPLGVAVSDPRWAGGRPAVLFRRGDADTRLWADDPADTAVSVKWSANGTDEPGAERFRLRLPPAPVASLELDLPADREPAAGGVLLSGPFPGSAADRRLWRVGFGGLADVELVIRRPGSPGEPGPAFRAGRTSSYRLGPAEADVSVAFDLEAVRGPAAELTFDTDPGLRVTGVNTAGPASWRADLGDKSDRPGTLRVTLPAPAAAARLTVTGVVAVPPGRSNRWPCPRVRLRDGLPGADAVAVWLDPDLKLIGVDPGDFRVTDAATADDRGYRIGLVGGLPPGAAGGDDRRPPVVRFHPAEPEFASTEDVTWRVEPGRTGLTGRFKVKVLRGPLARIPFQTGPGFTVQSVTLSPDDPGATWAAVAGGFVVEPSRPAATGQTVEVRVEVRGPPAPAAPDPADPAAARRPVPFPRLAPAGAAERDGVFTVAVAPALSGWADPLLPPADPPTLTYPYRGREPAGVLFLRPRPARVSVSADIEAAADGMAVTATVRLRVTAADGQPGALTVFTPAGDGATWDVRADAPVGATVQRRPDGEAVAWAAGLAGAVHPWAAVGGLAARPAPRGAVWRVTFPRPLRGTAELTAVARLTPTSGVHIPLPVVVGADPAAVAVALAPSAAARFAPPAAPTGGVVCLRPRGATPARPAADRGGWRFADLTLATVVEADGRLTCTFAGRVTGVGGRALPVVLPAGAEPLDAAADGRTGATADPDLAIDRPRLLLPLPRGGADGVRFAVRYRLPAPPGGPVAHFDSPAPDLPPTADAPPVARSWVVADGFRRPDTLGGWAAADGDTLTAVRGEYVAAGGYALAAAVAGVGLMLLAAGRRKPAAGFAVLVGLAGAAGWVAPDGWRAALLPAALAGLVVLAGYRLPARTRSARGHGSTVSYSGGSRPAVWPTDPPSAPRPAAPVATALLVLAGLLAAAASGQAPGPAVVYLTPAGGGSAGRLDVLAPPAVLDRLDALAAPPVPGPVVTAADYAGTGTDAVAAFDATFAVWCPTAGPHALTLPLARGRLGDLTVDGRPAFPAAAGPDRYTLSVSGAGRHEVKARFEVPVTAAGADREVRFAGPDAPSARVTFAAPPGAGPAEVASALGAKAVADGRTTADHGGGKEVVVRWRGGAGGGAKATVSVREACVWDVREADAVATAAFLYRIDGGSVTRLAIDIPDGLEPGRVLVRPTDPRQAGTLPGLREWTVGPAKDGWRTVGLRLQAPAAGRLTVVVKLYPRKPLGSRPVLRVPRAVGATDAAGYVAVRSPGLTADDLGRVGLIDIPADSMAREFAAAAPELGLDKPAAGRVFQRADAGGATPEVRLAVRPADAGVTGTAEMDWVVGGRADAAGAVRVAPRGGPAGLVEWELPAAVDVTEVRAADLAGWGRTGNRVQVWLTRPAREVLVRWVGGLPAAKATPGEPTVHDLPAPRLPGEAGPVTVRVRPADGWAVVPAPGPRPTAAADPPGGAVFRVDPSAPAPRFLAYPPPQSAAVRLLETAERDGDRLRYRAAVLVPLPAKRPTAFSVRLTGLPADADAELTAEPGTTAVGPVATPDGPAWELTATGGPARFALSARLPAGSRVPRPEPVVWVGGRPTTPARRFLALGPGVTPTAADGWEPADADAARQLAADWPADAGRIGRLTVWSARSRSESDGLAVTPDPPPPSSPSAPAGPSADAPAPAPTRAAAADRWAVATPWATAAAFLAGATAVGLAVAAGGRGLLYERLTLCGLLGAAAAGSDTPVGLGFAALAAAGLAGRVAAFVGRLAAVVMR